MRDFEDRAVPDDQFAQALALETFVASPLGRLLLGISQPHHASTAEEIAERLRTLRGLPRRIAELLGPRGWCASGNVDPDAYGRACELVEAGETDAADAVLVEAWNRDERLRNYLLRIVTLYEPSDHRLKHRRAAADEALRCHELGLYRGAIGIALPLLEGIVYDITDDRLRFFRRGQDADALVDTRTFAGHPASLPALSRLLGARQDTTEARGLLQRNGILHGRELDYGSLLNSTKALVALMTIVEWGQAVVQARIVQRATERERDLAGNPGEDDEGRRLDRRGFAEAKKGLFDIHLRQRMHFAAHGRYTSELSDLRYASSGAVTYHLSTDSTGSHCWTYAVTPSGWVFGLAAVEGDPVVWLWSGPTPPTGGIHDGSGWRHAVHDPAHVEW